jgi:hypothetical protein
MTPELGNAPLRLCGAPKSPSYTCAATVTAGATITTMAIRETTMTHSSTTLASNEHPDTLHAQLRHWRFDTADFTTAQTPSRHTRHLGHLDTAGRLTGAMRLPRHLALTCFDNRRQNFDLLDRTRNRCTSPPLASHRHRASQPPSRVGMAASQLRLHLHGRPLTVACLG